MESIIKYEGDSNALIWKQPIEEFTFGSQLIVNENQEVVFFKDDQVFDLLGSGCYTLESRLLPLLGKSYDLRAALKESFHAQIYFFNLTVQLTIKWDMQKKVCFIDPLVGTPLQLGASGETIVQVSDSKKLLKNLTKTIKRVSLEEGSRSTSPFKAFLQNLITTAVKANLPNAIKKNAIDILEIDANLDVISSNLREAIIQRFEECGLSIPEFYLTNIYLPEDDPIFKQVREVHIISLQARMH